MGTRDGEQSPTVMGADRRFTLAGALIVLSVALDSRDGDQLLFTAMLRNVEFWPSPGGRGALPGPVALCNSVMCGVAGGVTMPASDDDQVIVLRF